MSHSTCLAQKALDLFPLVRESYKLSICQFAQGRPLDAWRAFLFFVDDLESPSLKPAIESPLSTSADLDFIRESLIPTLAFGCGADVLGFAVAHTSPNRTPSFARPTIELQVVTSFTHERWLANLCDLAERAPRWNESDRRAGLLARELSDCFAH